MANASQSATREEVNRPSWYVPEIWTLRTTGKNYNCPDKTILDFVNNGIKARTLIFTQQCFDCDNEMRQSIAACVPNVELYDRLGYDITWFLICRFGVLLVNGVNSK